MPNWVNDVQRYCNEFNIPVEHLSAILRDSKVNPMIRGKGFEFSALDHLSSLLNGAEWKVSKPKVNAQATVPDVDILITNKIHEIDFTVECKLAKKGSFQLKNNSEASAAVKCMRSRTLGAAQVKLRAPQLGVSTTQLTVHNDNYWEDEFQIVLSSLGNAFYQTEKLTGDYVFSPNSKHLPAIQQILSTSDSNIQSNAFNYFFVARARDLTPKHRRTKCARRRCNNKGNCQFIPNYPEVEFDARTGRIKPPWLPISQLETLLKQILSE